VRLGGTGKPAAPLFPPDSVDTHKMVLLEQEVAYDVPQANGAYKYSWRYVFRSQNTTGLKMLRWPSRPDLEVEDAKEVKSGELTGKYLEALPPW